MRAAIFLSGGFVLALVGQYSRPKKKKKGKPGLRIRARSNISEYIQCQWELVELSCPGTVLCLDRPTPATIGVGIRIMVGLAYNGMKGTYVLYTLWLKSRVSATNAIKELKYSVYVPSSAQRCRQVPEARRTLQGRSCPRTGAAVFLGRMLCRDGRPRPAGNDLVIVTSISPPKIMPYF